MSAHQSARNLNVLSAAFIVYMFSGADISNLSVFGSNLNPKYPGVFVVAAFILFAWFVYRHWVNAPITDYAKEKKHYGKILPRLIVESWGYHNPYDYEVFRITKFQGGEASPDELVLHGMPSRAKDDNDNRVPKVRFGKGDQPTKKEYLSRLTWRHFLFNSDLTATHVTPYVLAFSAVTLVVLNNYLPLESISSHLFPCVGDSCPSAEISR